MKIELPPDFGQLYIDFAQTTNTTPDELVLRILKSRYQEMVQLLDFAEDHPEGTDGHDKAAELLADYVGGQYVWAAMKEIDPAYQTFEDGFSEPDNDLLNDSFLDELSSALDRSLKAPSQ